ncbi:MAG: type II toxin-antitoxin system prevent-host-death family antitoxin [Gammaproteobacteria bacterium]|nr:type II toxin-antitoxin system prevent-host-death family antitoxin [Gammaproteobacteria bacterium]
MDFVTARELRAESAKVWKKLEAGEDVVVTRNGKPFALLVNTRPEELEDTLRAIRGERFAATVRKMRRQAMAQGLDGMTMEEIDAEITQARREWRDRDAGGD